MASARSAVAVLSRPLSGFQRAVWSRTDLTKLTRFRGMGAHQPSSVCRARIGADRRKMVTAKMKRKKEKKKPRKPGRGSEGRRWGGGGKKHVEGDDWSV